MRGKFKYSCDDCGAINWIGMRERDRRSRPRCSFCGSTWLTPTKSSIAKKETVRYADRAREEKAEKRKKMGYNA